MQLPHLVVTELCVLLVICNVAICTHLLVHVCVHQVAGVGQRQELLAALAGGPLADTAANISCALRPKELVEAAGGFVCLGVRAFGFGNTLTST